MKPAYLIAYFTSRYFDLDIFRDVYEVFHEYGCIIVDIRDKGKTGKINYHY